MTASRCATLEDVAVLLVLLACGIWASVLADKRGLSRGAHFFLGLVLGPFGVLVTALRKPDHEALKNRPAKPLY